MKSKSDTLIKVLKAVAFYGVVILIWQVIYEIFVNILCIWKLYNFPSPWGVLKSLITLVSNGTLLIAVTVSFKRMLFSYILSIMLGFLLGMLMINFKFFEKNLSSLLLGIQSLPNVCWVPFAILWFGINDNAIYFITTIGSTLVIALGTMSGFNNIDPISIKAGKNLGAKGFKLYWNVILPASIPSILASMKQGWAFAWRGLIAGEMLVATKGIGQTLMMARELVDINKVTAIMIVIICLGLFVDKVVFENISKRMSYETVNLK